MSFHMYFIRHSKASYKYIAQVLKSNNPMAGIDFSKQGLDDVPDAGITLAKDKAMAFFSQLDKENTLVFFGSSVESRAFKTAQIFKKVAIDMGFKIGKAGSGFQSLTSFSDSDIRKIRFLSIRSKNNLIDSIYTPPSHLTEINWKPVLDSEFYGQRFKDEWENARNKFILPDDQGSWGGNFSAHSDHVSAYLKEHFPKLSHLIKNRVDTFNTDFKNTIALGKWCAKKVPKDLKKDVVVLGFAHENSIVYFLSKYFPHDRSLGNCEAIKFEFDEKSMKVTHADKVKVIENL